MPTRYTKGNELQQLQYEIGNEVRRDAPHIAQGVFGNNARHPDMSTVSNSELDRIYADAYRRNDREFLQQEAQRDPVQFLAVTDRLGVPDPPTDSQGKPIPPPPDPIQQAMQPAQAAQAAQLAAPMAPPVPTAPPGAAPMGVAPPAAPVGVPMPMPQPSQIPLPGMPPEPTVQPMAQNIRFCQVSACSKPNARLCRTSIRRAAG